MVSDIILFKGCPLNLLFYRSLNAEQALLQQSTQQWFSGTLTDRGRWFRPVRIRNFVQTSYEQLMSSG